MGGSYADHGIGESADSQELTTTGMSAQPNYRGLLEGFRIGFEDRQTYSSTKHNLHSAYKHPEVVQQYLDRVTQLQCLFALTSEEAQAVLHLQISVVFFASNPQAAPVPTGVPLCLQELVLNQTLLWTSPSWKRHFNTTQSTVWHLLPDRPTIQLSGATFSSAQGLELPNNSSGGYSLSSCHLPQPARLKA